MKIQKGRLSLLLVLILAAHLSWAGGAVAVFRGVGTKIVGKEMLGETAAAKVWQRGFSTEVIPVAVRVETSVMDASVTQAAKLPVQTSVLAATVDASSMGIAKVPSVAADNFAAQTAKLPMQTSGLRGEKIVSSMVKTFNLSRRAAVGMYRAFNRVSDVEIMRAVVEQMPSLPQFAARVGEDYLVVDSFKDISLEGYTEAQLPPYPMAVSKVNVYRGMHLKEDKAKNILKDGLRLEENPNNAVKEGLSPSAAQLLAFNPASSALTASMDLAGVTYTTASAEEAFHYATLGMEEGEVPVVLKLSKKCRNPQNKVKGRDHYLIREDILAEDIEDVLALVQGADGNPIWGRLRLSPNGDKLHLYPLVSPDIAPAAGSVRQQIINLQS